MIAQIDMGQDAGGRTVAMDLEELLATRLLVQGNSGSGKSHLLRRMLEGSAGLVQQVIVDPEGDFVTLAEAFGHVAVDAANYSPGELHQLAGRVREHRASVVLNLDGLEIDEQMRCAAGFLAALFDAPREHWYPVLVVVDEAQLFAPAAAGEVADDVRRVSLAAMTNLMCRGRKRGLAGVIATQRLAKLAKNVAAEASNFLMGRTFLDIDMARAADLLGMDRRQADTIRDLARGEFLALGPAISRRPISVRIGAVATAARSGSPRLVPLPAGDEAELRERLFAVSTVAPASPSPAPPSRPIADLIRGIADFAPPAPVPEMAELDEAGQEAVRVSVAAAIAAERSRTPTARLLHDYEVRCRMQGVKVTETLELFARRLAMATAGLEPDQDWDELVGLSASLAEEFWAPFMGLARAARAGEECPSDAMLAELYNTSSPRRARRMLGMIEETGLVVVRVDLAGKRSISLPHLGWTTKPAHPEPGREPMSRRSGRVVRSARGR